MRIKEYNQMMGYLTRPKDILSKEEKKEIVKDFYKKAEQPKSKPMSITRYIDSVNRMYNSEPLSDDEVKKRLADERFNDKILKRDKYEAPKKQIIKKTLIAKVEKPKPEKPPKPKPILPGLEHFDWTVAPWEDYPEDDDVRVPPPEDVEKILNIKKKEVAGLEEFLKLYKKNT